MGGGNSKLLWGKYIHCLRSATGYLVSSGEDRFPTQLESVPLGVPHQLDQTEHLQELLLLLSSLCAAALRAGMVLDNPMSFRCGDARIRWTDTASAEREGTGRVIAHIGPRGHSSLGAVPGQGGQREDAGRSGVDDRSALVRERGAGGEAQEAPKPEEV